MFGISHLAAMLSTPFVCDAAAQSGKKSLLAGMLAMSLCGGLIFGMLDLVKTTWFFLFSSYLLR